MSTPPNALASRCPSCKTVFRVVPDQLRVSAGWVRCGRCAEVVDGDLAAVGTISLTVPEIEPSADFKARLLARATAEVATSEEAPPTHRAPGALVSPPLALPIRPAASARMRWLLPLAAIFAVLLAGAGVLGDRLLTTQVVASAALENRAGRGSAEVLVRRSGEGIIQLSGFEDLSGGRVYQAWVIRPGQAPLATGATDRGSGILALDGDVRGAKVAVTIEARPGATAPTLPPFIIGDAPA